MRSDSRTDMRTDPMLHRVYQFIERLRVVDPFLRKQCFQCLHAQRRPRFGGIVSILVVILVVVVSAHRFLTVSFSSLSWCSFSLRRGRGLSSWKRRTCALSWARAFSQERTFVAASRSVARDRLRDSPPKGRYRCARAPSGPAPTVRALRTRRCNNAADSRLARARVYPEKRKRPSRGG